MSWPSGRQGVLDADISPDGDLIGQLAAAYRDGAIALWDPATGHLLYRLPGHDGTAADLDWNHDRRRLVSVGFDGQIRVRVTHDDELIGIAHSRTDRELTADECRQYIGHGGC